MTESVTHARSGPLAGIRVIELEALGPVPFAAMMLSDMGADVVRIDRPARPAAEDYNASEATNVVNRGRRKVILDLKDAAGVERFLDLASAADILLEGFRPGVMERLGVGPDPCLQRNPALIYVRVTGWGQRGPLAHTAGHDMNYLALSGTLGAIGPAGSAPVPPLNMLGDYAAGAMLAVVGALAAMHERTSSGLGQVVDAAIVDGAALLNSFVWGQHAAGLWRERGTNFLDGGSPYYAVYSTADARYVAVAAIEDRFFNELLVRAGIPAEALDGRRDPEHWPALRTALEAYFGGHTLSEITRTFEDSDACVTPVLGLEQVLEHPHTRERGTLREMFGLPQPAPAPRFSRTSSAIQGPPITEQDTTNDVAAILGTWRSGSTDPARE